MESVLGVSMEVALASDCCMYDGFFVVDRNGNSFMVNDCFILSWLPHGPVELEVEVVSFNESSKEMQVISYNVHLDKYDAIFSAKGEEGRHGKA